MLKKSVADGKSAIASAITSQGVNTAAGASYATMASNMKTVANNKYNAGYNANGDVKLTVTLQVAAYEGNYNAYCDLRIDGNIVFQWNGNANNQNGSFSRSI